MKLTKLRCSSEDCYVVPGLKRSAKDSTTFHTEEEIIALKTQLLEAWNHRS